VPVLKDYSIPRHGNDYVKPMVSVVMPVRNEHPQVITTMLCLTEELEYWGYPYEFIIVSNQSDDCTPEVLEDRFRHWVKDSRLRVVYFDERPACWDARNRGIEVARGQVLIVCDAHMSVTHGTTHEMIQLWLRNGGMWFSASQMWGDPKHVRLYGYDLKIEEKFWGNLCRHIPPEVFTNGSPDPYTIPMAQYSFFLLGREEMLEIRGFHPKFECYGGGEPYLSFKWWLLGKKIWMWPQGLVRHAFGLNPTWRDWNDRMTYRGQLLRGKGILSKGVTPESGDKLLGYGRNYSWNNDQLWYNFLLCAYVIGGEKWLEQRYQRYRQQCKKVERYLVNLDKLRERAFADGKEDREWISARQVCSFDELISEAPWKVV